MFGVAFVGPIFTPKSHGKVILTQCYALYQSRNGWFAASAYFFFDTFSSPYSSFIAKSCSCLSHFSTAQLQAALALSDNLAQFLKGAPYNACSKT